MKHRVVANTGAAFSDHGFARLVTAARDDARLADLVLNRPDLPEELRPFLASALAS